MTPLYPRSSSDSHLLVGCAPMSARFWGLDLSTSTTKLSAGGSFATRCIGHRCVPCKQFRRTRRDRYHVTENDKVTLSASTFYPFDTEIGFMKPWVISNNDSTSAATFLPTANDTSSLSHPLRPPVFSSSPERKDSPRSSGDETRYTLRQIYWNADKEIPLGGERWGEQEAGGGGARKNSRRIFLPVSGKVFFNR